MQGITMSTTLPTRPSDVRARDERSSIGDLERALPRLGLLERLALRIAMRALTRIEQIDREAVLRRHALVLENERRLMAAERAAILQQPLR